MRFEHDFYSIDADEVRTGAYYARRKYEGCGCSGCRNFHAAVERMEPTLRAFLEQFGIDPAKPMEMSVLCAPDANTVYYDGWYHLCGEILRGTDAFAKIDAKHFQLRSEAQIQMPNDTVLFFQLNCHLLDPDFPRPSIQMAVTFSLPWVLDEENCYLYP